MENLLVMRSVTKRYGDFTANDGVDFSLREGEIHAVAGENGAGKSTLMKILFGAERPDAGEILWRGERVRISSPREAARLGIGMVYQHFMLVDELPVYQNVFLGMEETRAAGVLRKKDMIAKTRDLCARFDMPVDALARCGDLPVGLRQKVEILKVLARGASLVILDEPTAVLTPQETEELFHQLRLLRAQGHTIVIITHKLREIKELCDRVTILRAGRSQGVYAVSDVSQEQISRLMVGGSVLLKADKAPAAPGDTLAELQHVTVPGAGGRPLLDNVSLCARAGEIVCFAGVEGNGQHEAAACLTGAVRYTGAVRVLGREIRGLSVRAVRGLGLCSIPADRMTEGANVRASAYENLIALDYYRHARLGFLKKRFLRARSAAQMQEYRVKGALDQPLSALSGGNMQKVIVARELSCAPRVVVADQPTRGVDVGAIAFIHAQLIKMRDAGCCVVLVSADLGEVLSLADRILVFHAGRVAKEITDVPNATERQLGHYMLGLGDEEAEAAQ